MTATTERPQLTITKPGVYPGIDDATYHRDPVPGGSLSSTGARRILDSPARFKWEQTHRVESRAFDVGHAVHAKVLGVGAPIVAYPDEHLTPAGNPSTGAAARAWAAEQRAAGLTVISRADAELVDAMAEKVLAKKAARDILEQPGDVEVSAFATDPDTGVTCRARFDYLNPHLGADLKTTTGSAGPRFASDAAKYGYPIQEAHYTDTLAWATGVDERVPMAFIVVEKRPPHLVAVHYFDEITRMVARDLAARARALYAECTATDTWPGYSDTPYITQVAGWWLDQADDQEDMEIR